MSKRIHEHAASRRSRGSLEQNCCWLPMRSRTRLGSFRSLANWAAPCNKTSRKRVARLVNMTSRSIRYFRKDRPEDVGLLLLPEESDLAAYKTRLEDSGYVVGDNPTVGRLLPNRPLRDSV